MSNLATRERLRQSTSQLPVSWYNDPVLLELERKVLFDRGPGYVGHELMVVPPHLCLIPAHITDTPLHPTDGAPVDVEGHGLDRRAFELTALAHAVFATD